MAKYASSANSLNHSHSKKSHLIKRLFQENTSQNNNNLLDCNENYSDSNNP